MQKKTCIINYTRGLCSSVIGIGLIYVLPSLPKIWGNIVIFPHTSKRNYIVQFSICTPNKIVAPFNSIKIKVLFLTIFFYCFSLIIPIELPPLLLFNKQETLEKYSHRSILYPFINKPTTKYLT